MTTQELALALAAANFVLTWGVALYMYLSNKNKATNERIGKLEHALTEKQNDHAKRITQLETTVDGVDDIGARCPVHGERLARLEEAIIKVPTHEDLGDMHEKINRVAGEMSGMRGELSGVKNVLHLIHNHLLTGGKA